MIGAALCRHSSHSASGIGVGGDAAADAEHRVPAASNSTVRIATLSSVPATGDAKPTVPQ